MASGAIKKANGFDVRYQSADDANPFATTSTGMILTINNNTGIVGYLVLRQEADASGNAIELYNSSWHLAWTIKAD